MNAPTDLQALVAPYDTAMLRSALREAAARGLPLVALLEAQGEDPQVLSLRLARSAALPHLDRHALDALTPAFDALPYTEAVQRECLFMRDAAGAGVLVVANPFDADLQAWAQERVRCPMALRVAARGDIEAWLARHEESLRAMDGLSSEQAGTADDARAEDISLRSIGEDTSPVVRLVNSTLYDALKAGASDIHLETGPGGIAIKYRIDGVLASVGHIAGSDTADQVVSRIKVMAELDIAERRVPQDGRFKVAARGRRIDIRVSIMPSIHGEDAVLRVLDKERLADAVSGLTLDTLGFDAATKDVLRGLCRQPYGMVLVTGPTGSGKTTTLYGAINEIHSGHDKIVTIEDPVEYQLGGVLQIPVNEKKGLTFARGLRSILRHDPDKIMVGEIRDAETAQIAVQAALTGHLVLTTVHANNVFDVLGRFTHMGLDPYSLMAALNGIVAQRLVRVLCKECSVPAAAPDLMAAPGEGQWRSACGCAGCRGTGYKGRKAVAEVLVLDDELREAIVGREPVRRIKELAFAKGTRELREAALALARRGETSLQEVQRVVR
ncbi:GspE/PulE family protein [Hydrogenophaga sp.]|uniref:GspE/PulE family protein n=2 Tax=unclassified Hydrogenophaga TaxID=2610897 RepID=UPI00257A8AF8|nr:GspE/PulE family protein [Hydrogenophaga sp.]